MKPSAATLLARLPVSGVHVPAIPNQPGSLLLFILSILFASGCSYWITTEPAVTPLESTLTRAKYPAPGKAYLGLITTKLSGLETDLWRNESTTQLQDTLRETKLFSDVILGGWSSPGGEPVTRFSAVIDQRLDLHQGRSAINAVLFAFSLTILDPVLLHRNDYQVKVTLEAVRRDGATRRYTASAKGTAKFQTFASPFDPMKVAGYLREEVMKSALNNLMKQVTLDATFYSPQVTP